MVAHHPRAYDSVWTMTTTQFTAGSLTLVGHGSTEVFPGDHVTELLAKWIEPDSKLQACAFVRAGHSGYYDRAHKVLTYGSGYSQVLGPPMGELGYYRNKRCCVGTTPLTNRRFRVL